MNTVLILQTLMMIWIMWALFNIAVVVFLRVTDSHEGVYVVGFWFPRIVISKAVKDQLTEEECIAVYMHERGHIECHHLRTNLAMAILIPFMRRPMQTVVKQELEADEWAARCGYAYSLASALRKLSAHPFDLWRASRLELRGAMPRPGERDARVANIREG